MTVWERLLDSPARFVRGKILYWTNISCKVVVITKCILVFIVALLDATVCASVQSKVSSEKHIGGQRR